MTLGAALLTAPPAAAVEPVLLINQDFADPDVLRTGDGFTAFATGGQAGRIPVARAPSATGPWTVGGDALADPPRWADGDGRFWAPDVSSRGGDFLMYFAAQPAGTDRLCIGAALSAEAAGPYHPVGDAPLVCVPEDHGDIDPESFVDADGRRYLLYKSGTVPSGIWLQEVTADGLGLAGQRRLILRADRPGENGVVEAPAMVRVPRGYVLLYSGDRFDSTGYHTGYATAPAPAGPFTKAAEPLLTTAEVGGAVDGPGGADVVDGRIYFHGWLNGQRIARGVYSLPVRFEPGGRPVIG
ncbi:glycoside hydrolase family 43 protein [Amycolatopsis suaedae]|uniref:glycoside hydrolase family 43 protein n=1 Tax=Amycolatopsis suaedae TaxID=2510978 RepID=UPI001F0E2DC8|nr:glycoside hydrolase family 43 protein [Amycolatopsis suaedae]